jgi:hypothetical protein
MGIRAAILAGGAAMAALWASSADAAVLITVDKSTQRMTVAVDGAKRWQWKVSTGRVGHATPSGAFGALSLDAHHFSKKYDNAPMPHSIFFTDLGHAIHGSFAVGLLGTPASHGCVRLEPSNATRLFALVAQQGIRNTTIVIGTNAADVRARIPAPPAPAAPAAPAAPPSAWAAIAIPDSAIAAQAEPSTLYGQPAVLLLYRQAFYPQSAEPPLAPESYPPFPRPWNVSTDVR